MLRRPLLFLLLSLIAAPGFAVSASADDALVVLDRGRGAKRTAHRYEQTALRLVEALGARGFDVRLALYGTRPDGRVRASRLSGDLVDRLARAAAKEGWRYEAPTDPRHALAVSLRNHEGAGPLLVILVGPFSDSAARDGARPDPADAGDAGDAGDGAGSAGGAGNGASEPEGGSDPDVEAGDEPDGGHAGERGDVAPGLDAQAAEALATWEADAPRGSRIFAPDLTPLTSRLITHARGVVHGGAIVLAAGEAVAIPEPWSPLAAEGPEAVLEAVVEVELDVLTTGVGLRRAPLIATSSDGRSEITAALPLVHPDDAAETTRGGPRTGRAEAGRTGVVRLALRRPVRAGDDASRVETVSFEAQASPSVLWLAEAPQPRTIQWTTLRPDARAAWFAPIGGVDPAPIDATRPLDADPLLVGRPLVRTCRVEHTRVGETPDWHVKATRGELPEGLAVSMGDVVNLSEEIASRDLEFSFAASPGEPGSYEGTLVLEAPGHPRRFELPYHVVVPPGRVVARLTAADTPRRLPAAADARPWTLLVEEESPNAPQLVRVEAVLDPPTLASVLTARLVGGGSVDVGWDLSRPLELRPGRRYDLYVDLAAGVRAAEGVLGLRLPEQRGLEGRAEGRGRIASRSPRLVVRDGPRSYSVDGGEVFADPPLVLEVDADGGGGDWRLALLETTPVVTLPPDTPLRFGLRSAGPGRWALVPENAWQGARGDTFSAREEAVHVRVTWSPGDVPGEAPGDLVVLVRIEPRWGKAGWILAGLAILALALGLWGLTQMRAAPVDGTLLYQVEGRQAAVGRLDLAPTGRRAIPIHADAAGRLILGPGAGRVADPVAVVRPTRIGGMLELPSCTPPERHLLVDGLTVSTGRHRIRYVSARPGDATVPPVPGPEAELLGPEFDLPSGRIDALEREDR